MKADHETIFQRHDLTLNPKPLMMLSVLDVPIAIEHPLPDLKPRGSEYPIIRSL